MGRDMDRSPPKPNDISIDSVNFGVPSPPTSGTISSHAASISTHCECDQTEQDDSTLKISPGSPRTEKTYQITIQPILSDRPDSLSAASATTAKISLDILSTRLPILPTDSVIVRYEDPSGKPVSLNLRADALDTLSPFVCTVIGLINKQKHQHTYVLMESSDAALTDQRGGGQGDLVKAQLDPSGSGNETTPEIFVPQALFLELLQNFERARTADGNENSTAEESRDAIPLIKAFRAHTLGGRQDLTIERGLARGTALAQHGASLVIQATATQDFACLDRGIDALFDALKYLPEAHSTTPPVVRNLGGALAERFDRFGNVYDLEQAITLQLQAVDRILDKKSVASCPPEVFFSLLKNLGTTFEMRFDLLGEMSDLEQAIVMKSRSVDLVPDGHPDMPIHLDSLGSAFAARFDRLEDMSDLERAISLMSRSVDLTPEGHSHMPIHLHNLGSTFETRFDRLGEIDDLEQAISFMTRSVKLRPEGHPHLPIQLSCLGSAVGTRFDRLGELEDLDRAISLGLRSVDLTPEGHPYQAAHFNSLGNAFERRFDHLGEMSDLEQAIKSKSRSVDLTPEGHARKASYLNNLGNAFEKRFDRLGKMDDLDQAISLKLRSIDLASKGYPEMPTYLNNLGAAYVKRFNSVGEMGNLERAISFKIRSIDLMPEGHPSMPGYLNNLGIALEIRFQHLGEIDDIERAISLKSRSVELTPEGHSDMPSYLSNLGNAFMMRSNRRGEIEDLERAISLKSRSVDLTPEGHPLIPSYLNNLGNAFELRYDRRGEMSDLERAISLKSRSVELTPEGHPDISSHLNNLSRSLEERFNRAGDLEDLERSIEYRRRSVSLTHPSHLNFLVYLNSLGHALQTHFISTGHSGNSPEAVKCYEEAMVSDTGPSRYRLQAVEELVSLHWHSLTEAPNAAHPYDQLVSAYEHAYTLIPEVVWLGSSITRRYALLADIKEIIGGAAAAAIAIGQLTRAVEWMEQGRGIVWNQLLQLRNPMDELFEHHPILAQQLQHISRELEKSANTIGEVPEGSDTNGDSTVMRQNETTRRIGLARDRKELLSKIRGLEGFNDFLMPSKYAGFVHAWESGPVVLINTFKSRCDALVCLSADRVIHIPLPDLHHKIIQPMLARSLSFEDVLRSGHHERAFWTHPTDQASNASDEPGKRKTIPEADSQLELLLYALWQYIVDLILKVIKAEPHEYTNEALPHVTWCATGLLASLPLHAAGDYGTPGGKKAFDYIVSSYAPTLSSLLRSSERQLDPRLPLSKVLVISQSDTPGHSSLPGTADEIARLKEHFPEDAVTHLSDSDATVSAVLKSMDENPCPYVHFACHGTQDSADPTKSAFILHDGSLELRTLMSKSTNNATLAFLSACQTATGDVKLTEESVHLAAGMLAVGYQGVIGTLRSIHDDDAPLVADEFYRVLKERQVAAAEGAKGGSKVHAAYALHEATKKLRGRVGESNVMRWAPFVHFGR